MSLAPFTWPDELMAVAEETRTLGGVACGAVIRGEPVIVVAASAAGARIAAEALGIAYDPAKFVALTVQLPRH